MVALVASSAPELGSEKKLPACCWLRRSSVQVARNVEFRPVHGFFMLGLCFF